MIYIHTGLPGAGKTLFTLQIVRERARKENRAVYYHGIEILKPEEFEGWQPLDDPSKWFELPDGAIIIHDEAQTLYRPRGNGAQVPEHVAKLETHRHKGHDIYFVTQHPMLIDSNVRRLAGEHMHVVRSFGAKVATLHRWSQCKEQCDKSRADSIRETVGYPAQLFSAYKSATLHTHKPKIPKRVFMLLVLPFVFIGLLWGFYAWWDDFGTVEAPAAEGAAGEAVIASQATAPGTGSRRRDAPAKTIAEWVAERRPRVEGLPHTAPVYDGVTQVAYAPVPAVCIAAAERCVCYTQQATRMNTPESLCRQIAATGYFVEWDTSPAQDGRERRELAAAPPTAARDVDRLPVSDNAGLIRSGGTWSGVPPMGR